MSDAYWRINPLAIIGAATALISVFLPWWGLYEILGSTTLLLARWNLWSPPNSAAIHRLGWGAEGTATASGISQTITLSSLIVLTLALVAAALSVVGGLTLVRKYLAIGLGLSILSPVAYSITIAYTTSRYCLTPLCISGVAGSTAPLFGTTFTWGFETGFYISIATIIALALAAILNTKFSQPTMISRTEAAIPTDQKAKREP